MEQALEVGLAAWPFHEGFNFIQSSEGVYLGKMKYTALTFHVPRKVVDAIKQIWRKPCHIGDGGSNLVQDLLNATRKYPTLIYIPLDFLNDVFRY
jgi:hypothetical protein